MIQDVFTDGVGNIHVTGNVVRLDFISLNPNQKNELGQPIYNVTQRIVMPLEGFIQSLALQENIVKQLVDAGVLKRTENEQVEAGKKADPVE